MGHSQAGKAENRERILEAAAARIREAGLESISVARLMGSVGLTHGGFYNHFESRSQLLVEALGRALAEGQTKARGTPARRASLTSFVRGYLSRRHRDSPATGCAIAALLSDVGRADPDARRVMEQHIEAFIARMAEGQAGDHDARAIVAVSAMIGALGIARVVADRERSDAILGIVGDFVVGMLGDE